MHDGSHYMKFHYVRLIRTARLLGKLDQGKTALMTACSMGQKDIV